MIEQIIEEELVEIYFQPIVSIRTKTIYAFEALTRCNFNGQNIPPNLLFSLAKEKGLHLELDEMTRIKAIKKFHQLFKEDNDLILFLNFESDIINNFEPTDYSSRFIETIISLKMPFKNFVLEIKEDEITSTKPLEGFCKTYKSLGFSIALDDFGTGNSNFHRINLIRPNIIKIDKSLFDDIKNNQINKEVVKSISKMSHNLGIRVLAEGVEDTDCICIGMKAGINLFQGFFFQKPLEIVDEKKSKEVVRKISNIGILFKRNTINSINKKRENIEMYDNIAKVMVEKVSNIYESTNIFQNEFEKHEDIEAIYLIDEDSSKQVNDTIISDNVDQHFRATKDGEEHYLKEYYYITLESKQGIYLSQKYISYASGNVCKTFAKKFNLQNKGYILCLDIVVEGLENGKFFL